MARKVATANLDVHDMRPQDAEYVGTCSHIAESDEIDASARRRLPYLDDAAAACARTLVATVDGTPFLHNLLCDQRYRGRARA